MRIMLSLLAGTALVFASSAHAEEDRIGALERRLAEQQQRIQQLETLVAAQAARLEHLDAPAPVPAIPASVAAVAAFPSAPPPAAATTASAARASETIAMRIPGLDVSGDLRIRQEWNTGGARARARSVLRARLRATYAATDKLSIGGQITTGDPDDPNSTDVTLGNFLDDFAVSLDQAWIRYANGGLTVQAGKFPQIFQRTDMVWDGDVSPQGAAVSYSAKAGAARLDARALYFVVDEAPLARDSDMLGGQVAFAAPLAEGVRLGLSGSYYHYRLGSVTGADAGDFRGNLVSGGHYLSDFHLIEGIGTLNWTGASARWPLSFTADVVRNLGAAVPGDTGFNLELAAGRTAQAGDWRIAYNYSDVEVDAVLAAFAHDNIDLSTNYRLHGLAIGYVPASNLQLDLAWYHYRPLDAAYAAALSASHWLDRVRLNFMVQF